MKPGNVTAADGDRSRSRYAEDAAAFVAHWITISILRNGRDAAMAIIQDRLNPFPGDAAHSLAMTLGRFLEANYLRATKELDLNIFEKGTDEQTGNK